MIMVVEKIGCPVFISDLIGYLLETIPNIPTGFSFMRNYKFKFIGMS